MSSSLDDDVTTNITVADTTTTTPTTATLGNEEEKDSLSTDVVVSPNNTMDSTTTLEEEQQQVQEETKQPVEEDTSSSSSSSSSSSDEATQKEDVAPSQDDEQQQQPEQQQIIEEEVKQEVVIVEDSVNHDDTTVENQETETSVATIPAETSSTTVELSEPADDTQPDVQQEETEEQQQQQQTQEEPKVEEQVNAQTIDEQTQATETVLTQAVEQTEPQEQQTTTEVEPATEEQIKLDDDQTTTTTSVVITETDPATNSHSVTKQLEMQKLSLQLLQKKLKEQERDTDQQITTCREKITELKRDLILEAKQNWVIEQQVEVLGNKIRLLIKNHLAAEDMKSIIDSSLHKVKMLTKDSAQGISDAALEVYEKIFYLFRTKPQYLAALTRLVRGKQIDTLLQTVVFTLFGDQFDEREENLLLQLFEHVLIKEYSACTNIGEFMRSNTAFTKMLSAVLRRSQYHQYILEVLTNPIQAILADKDLNLEINPAKVYSELVADSRSKGTAFDGPETVSQSDAADHKQVKELVAPRIDQIRKYVKIFLDEIFSKVQQTPYGVRFMCKKIFEHGRSKFANKVSLTVVDDDENAAPKSVLIQEEEVYSLVGGLVFLRFLNPAITTCDTPAVNIVNQKLTTPQRKNLTMVCKVIQNLSNGVLFGSKEQYMVPLNNIIEEYTPAMQEYFAALIHSDEDISERMEMDQFVELAQDMKHINISYNEVVLLHKLCEDNMNTIAPLPNDQIRILLNNLRKLGPPPDTVTPKENYYFNMKLRNPSREQEVDDLKVKEEQELKKKARASISSILRDLPTLPSQQHLSLADVLNSGKQKAIEKEDQELAQRIKQGMELLEKVQKMEGGIGADNELILRDIFQELENKTKIRQESEKKLQLLLKVLSDVQSRRHYLNSQLDMYNTYFQNALSKTLQSDHKALVYPLKLKELMKQQVVVDCKFDKVKVKATRVTFSSKTPGKFEVSVHIDKKKTAEIELDLNELLEKQSKKETRVNIDQGVDVDVDALILMLNKLFVGKERKGTKLKKVSKKSLLRSGTIGTISKNGPSTSSSSNLEAHKSL